MVPSTRKIWALLAALAAAWTVAAGSAADATASPAHQFMLTPTPTATLPLSGVLPPPGVVAPPTGANVARGPVFPPTLTPTPVILVQGAVPTANGGVPSAVNPYAPLVGNLEVAPPPQPVPGATVLVVPPGVVPPVAPAGMPPAGMPLSNSTATPTPTLLTAPLAVPYLPAAGPPRVLPSPIPTATLTPTPTNTPTMTATPTVTSTPTVTPTATPSIRAPVNLRMVSAGPAPGMFTLAWDPANTETVMEYHVQAVGAGGELRQLFTLPGSGSQAAVQGLDPAIGYTLVLRAVDVLGRESGPSNVAQTAAAPTATPVTPPFSNTQQYGSGGAPVGGGQVPQSPYGPAAPNNSAPFSGAPPPYNQPASPYGPARQGVPPAYQPGITGPTAGYVPTPTVSVYQQPVPGAAPYGAPYAPR